PGSEHAFLYGIAIRIAAQARRKQHDNPEIAGEAGLERFTDPRPTPEDAFEEVRLRAILDQGLDQMPADLREGFGLFALDEIEIPEIATFLDIPVGTVGSRLRRAREEFSAITKRVRARMEFRRGQP